MSSPRPQTHLPPPSATASPKPSLLPSPFLDRDHAGEPEPEPIQPTTASIYSHHPDPQDGEQYPYIEAYAGSLLPPHNFGPLFTLIRDSKSGEYVHPSVYYVFSDDETDTMSTAALHALDSFAQDVELSDKEATTAPVDTDVEDRYVVVDLTADGGGIADATSLSHKWAVTDAKLAPAPVFGSADDDGVGSLMLVVEGLGIPAGTTRSGGDHESSPAEVVLQKMRNKHSGSLTEAMIDISTTLSDDLDVLDKIMSAD